MASANPHMDMCGAHLEGCFTIVLHTPEADTDGKQEEKVSQQS